MPMYHLDNRQWVPAKPLGLQDGTFIDSGVNKPWCAYQVVNGKVTYDFESRWWWLARLKLGVAIAWNRRDGEGD